MKNGLVCIDRTKRMYVRCDMIGEVQFVQENPNESKGKTVVSYRSLDDGAGAVVVRYVVEDVTVEWCFIEYIKSLRESMNKASY